MPRGWVQHRAAVQRLVDSYHSLPEGSPIRLAKQTSNLFRPRQASVTSGLDVSGLDGVIDIDPTSRTAQVQGMCTYEELVAVTLRHGLMPLVVPQLRTITLGGAVTGLGIESSSLFNGLPHESVHEIEVLTGSGELVTASAEQNRDLLQGFPNSYGTLGYAVRLRIELQPVTGNVALEHVRFHDPESLVAAVGELADTGGWQGRTPDFVDGVMFAPNQGYLSLANFTDQRGPVSDYTGQRVFYRSIPDRRHDLLTVHDYLWRWDTDWFWCSRALGAQHPAVRRVWPAAWRRSDVYHRIVNLENRYRLTQRWDRARGNPERERVVQDVELPLQRTAEFLQWFDRTVGMRPVWLCPLRLRERGGPLGELAPGDEPWSLYPMRAGQTYINVGFWGAVAGKPGDRAEDGAINREIERAVAGFDGHKSLYSDVYYDQDQFWSNYGGEEYHDLKRHYDPNQRLLGLYDKAVHRR